MLDELMVIDLFERMRGAVVEAAPSMEREIVALREQDFRKTTLDEAREHLVSVLLDIDLSVAAGRRQARRLARTLDRDEPLAQSIDALLDVADDRARGLRASDLTQRNLHDLRDALARLDEIAGPSSPAASGETASEEGNNGDGLAARLEAEGDPARVASFVVRRIPHLKGLRAYAFLSRLGYPVLTPDASRQRLLYRLGLWEEPGQSKSRHRAFQDLGQTVARLTGEAVAVLDFLLGLQSGAVARPSLFAPVCLARPHCDDCRLQGRCSYYRYRGASEERERSTLRQMRPENRPREKFERLGPDQATDAELLAILLRTGTAGRSALEVANALLHVFETLEGIEAASVSQLRSVRGVGAGKAVEIKAALELGRRLFTRPLSKGVTISCSSDVYNAYKLRFRTTRQEEFLLLCLNTKNQVIKEVVVTRGSLNQSLIQPREVFKEAIRESANAVLFLHNHPSGDPRPSESDIALTRRLETAGEMLSIKTLDHIVIGDQSYYSFLDHQLI